MLLFSSLGGGWGSWHTSGVKQPGNEFYLLFFFVFFMAFYANEYTLFVCLYISPWPWHLCMTLYIVNC